MLVANGLGADPEHPYMETLAASNDTAKRQIVTINTIYSYRYHTYIYRGRRWKNSVSCLKGFCFTSFIFPGMIVTETE